jgi:hypothetical protein
VQAEVQEEVQAEPALVEETFPEEIPVEVAEVEGLEVEVEVVESLPVLEVEPEEAVVALQESVQEEVIVEKGMAFPEFFVKKTVWHPRADQRVAYVAIPKDSDPKPVREGDSIENLEVLTIEPAAVILGRDGVEVRKRVGEE